ncbi:OmpA family protein [Ovoidimarina sediminis]|uniref:OmpA family protein n=1 Tax=Ovoidimarina sediminis TaxID=3079856 RepID=UPI0029085497|nr:OmpA family protein [Rhodophyticola sp. MJ-SS7]MDU8945911.1 OmpA family protein [Rhodophyticola sp. MJ-SS7]
MILRTAWPAMLWLIAAPALALEVPPSAVLASADESPAETRLVPVGPWTAEGTEVTRGTGAVRREAWTVPGTALTTDQLTDPLIAGLARDGYTLLFSCRDNECGGFDFRYELDLLPEPEMHVDLGDYAYAAARAPGDDGELIALTVSRSATTGYIHILRIDPGGAPRPTPAPTPPPTQAAAAEPVSGEGAGLTERLMAEGHVALEDLAFATGSATLEDRPFASLAELAAWMRDRPGTRITLVGHSDAVGALDRNIALSRARAEAVALRLVEAHDIAPARLSAEGVGYLAPRAPNDTEAGRAVNRRVEVVLQSE